MYTADKHSSTDESHICERASMERNLSVEGRKKRIQLGEKKWIIEKSRKFFFSFSVKYAIFSICFRDLPYSTLVKLCVSFVVFLLLHLLACPQNVRAIRKTAKPANACVSNLTFSHFEFFNGKDFVYVLEFLASHHF